MDGKILMKMIEYFGNDIKRINHALKVYGFAKAIAGGENLDGRLFETVETAAVLHDIGIKEAERRHNSSAGIYQELEGPPIAGTILENLKYSSEFADRVCFLVGHHHSYDKIDNIDFQILVEADFLVNLDEEKAPVESVLAVKRKYFKTGTGKKMIDSLFGLSEEVID